MICGFSWKIGATKVTWVEYENPRVTGVRTSRRYYALTAVLLFEGERPVNSFKGLDCPVRSCCAYPVHAAYDISAAFSEDSPLSTTIISSRHRSICFLEHGHDPAEMVSDLL